MKYKKYILFSYVCGLEEGGIEDIVGSFDDPEEAFDAYYNDYPAHDTCAVIDRDTWEEV